ncbi:hypothetical protein [Streptomyces sp. SP18CS02]|uniref:hypothetical protein n=1 Tax=Streptomyces sp. SP18CS02 TaxID=3002531 RepID=UPI002E75BA8B|nr:hypothetical protein [Streptomyces sp. SP18CS02]MEE1755298.1 hypothetical protein [Streptomyces sp. SP18CS02]
MREWRDTQGAARPAAAGQLSRSADGHRDGEAVRGEGCHGQGVGDLTEGHGELVAAFAAAGLADRVDFGVRA